MHFKKQISIIIALLILVSSSGLAFNVHFCEGEIAAFSSAFSKEEVCEMPVKEENTCCAKPDKQHKKCCSNKEVNLKNKTEKMVFKTISFHLDAVFFLNKRISTISNSIVAVTPKTNLVYYCDANAPPLYLLYSQHTLFG